MGKKRSSTQIEKLSAPKEDEPPTPAPRDDGKPHPEEDKVSEHEDDEDSSASSSEAEEDDDEEEDTPSKNSSPPLTNPRPKTEDDSDSEDDEDETDSDSEDEPAPKLKSLNSNSKPVDQIKSKADPKPSSAPPARSGTKRPVDNDPIQSKKRKTQAPAEEDNKKSGDESKKLFQRVFNEDDEMAILKGIYDFITKTGTDPFKYHTAFYEFVKKSIHIKVTLEQLRDKMRRLKHKYETKAKSGKTPNFTKDNNRIMFEFGQKIWGGKLNVNEAEEKGKPNGKLSKKEPAAKKPRTTKKLVLEPDSPLPVVKETRKVESTDTENPGSGSGSILALNELIRFDESVSGSGKTVGAMKRGLELMGESEREELERRWEKVQVAELEVFKMRADLAVDQAISILDALKSSSGD
ncbi:unnamed protein product [Lathyrus oleraceus]